MPILRSVVAKQCKQTGCNHFRQRVGRHEGFCTECGHRLSPVLGWDPRQIALVIGAPLALALLAGSSVFFLLNRPRPLTEERRQLLESWVRETNRDRIVTPREKADLERLVKRERLDAGAAQDFVAATRKRLESSLRSAERGHEHAVRGELEAARREFQQAVREDPKNAAAWANLGMAQAATGHEQEAFDSYTRTLQIDPGNWAAHYNLGRLWIRRNNFEEALRHLTAAFAACPDPASPYRQSMVSDLKGSPLPAALRRDRRFLTLLADSEEPAR